MFASLIVTFVFVVIFVSDSTEIQNVRLVLPPIVPAGASSTFLCLYDLEGASLYSVQWYRGQFEFFRYVPGESPPTKVFSIPGLHVDILTSNERQVTLRNIPVQISGEFSCEVTTDAPPFRASCISENLTVVNLDLNLNVGKTTYTFGEILAANCSVTPRLGSMKLKFYWNNRPISERFTTDEFQAAHLNVNTSVLYTDRLQVGGNIGCSAILEDMNYLLSKTRFLKLQPKPVFRSTATKPKFHFFIVPLTATFIIIK